MSHDEELDMRAVQRDEEIIEALAARRPVDAGDDIAVRVLAALVADVDEGLDIAPAPSAADAPAVEPAADDPVVEARRSGARAGRRRLGRRGIVALTVSGVFVSVSGVATAVTGAVTTGDPLTPFKQVVSAVTGADRQPSTAATAKAEKIEQKLREADEAIRRGDRATAERKLREAREALQGLPSPAAEATAEKVKGLEKKLRGSASGTGPNTPGTPDGKAEQPAGQEPQAGDEGGQDGKKSDDKGATRAPAKGKEDKDKSKKDKKDDESKE